MGNQPTVPTSSRLDYSISDLEHPTCPNSLHDFVRLRAVWKVDGKEEQAEWHTNNAQGRKSLANDLESIALELQSREISGDVWVTGQQLSPGDLDSASAFLARHAIPD